MSQTRKQQRSVTAAQQFLGTMPWGRLLANPTVWIFAATIGLIVAAQQYWHNGIGKSGEVDPQFALRTEQVVINEPDLEIGTAPQQLLRVEFLQASRSLLDAQLVRDLADYLKTWPFVQSIQSIVKTHQGVTVRVTYREPVALVEWKTPHEAFRRYVDDLGQIMPQPTAPKDRQKSLLRINVIEPVMESLRDWSVWPDERIQAATRIACDLRGSSDRLGIYRIVTYRRDRRDFSQPFELWTARGGKIVWSDDPMSDSAEIVAAKLRLLNDWQERNGSFDQLAGWKKLDVREGKVRLVDDASEVANRPFGIPAAR